MGIKILLFATHKLPAQFIKEELHPLHMDVEIFNYNPYSQTFEITLRVFMDNVQEVLDINHIKADLYTYKDSTMLRKFYFPYIENNIKLFCNGKLLPLEWVGYELENGTVFFYIESGLVDAIPQNIEVQSTFFCKYFEQSHIVEIHVNKTIRNSTLNCDNMIFKTQF
ncbi:MAG: DUF6702 family protein [Chitinophagaceae bacterium]